MPQEYFKAISDLARKTQEPLQAMAELNIKALQNISYIKPDELAQVKSPVELWEKNMKVAVENGQNALWYLQKSAEIIEKSALGFVQEAKKAKKAAEDKK